MNKVGERAVSAYIAAAPTAAQPMLRQLRQIIRAAAPQAEERISYGMPFYEYRGRFAYFAGYRNHVGFYMVGEGKTRYAKQLEKFKVAKATVRFPLGHPLPVALINKLLKFRLKELEAER